MSESTLAINFAFGDGTTRVVSAGSYDVSSDAVNNFKNRVKSFNSEDETAQKKVTNLVKVYKSDNGAEITGIKSATITVSEITRIYDASNYGG